jgi:hypothetical protein
MKRRSFFSCWCGICKLVALKIRPLSRQLKCCINGARTVKQRLQNDLRSIYTIRQVVCRIRHPTKNRIGPIFSVVPCDIFMPYNIISLLSVRLCKYPFNETASLNGVPGQHPRHILLSHSGHKVKGHICPSHCSSTRDGWLGNVKACLHKT